MVRWYNKKIDQKSHHFVVPMFVYSLSKEIFTKNIDRVLEKFGKNPEFNAVIALREVYANYDEVYGGMGFFYYPSKQNETKESENDETNLCV